MNREMSIRSDESGIDERTQEQNHSGGITARVRHLLGLRNALSLPRHQFRQPVNPTVSHAMCGTGVEDTDRRVGQPSGGFSCGIVGKAKEYDVCVPQRLAARCRVSALLFGKDDDLEIIPTREPVPDPKRRGSGLTVNVKFGSHCKLFLSRIEKNCTLICTA